MVLSVQDIRVSRHKDAHPEDSDGPEDIGLSSEEEAEGMEEDISIARKYHQRAGPAPTPGAPGAASNCQPMTQGPPPQILKLPHSRFQWLHYNKYRK